jgi:hypothetical protein
MRVMALTCRSAPSARTSVPLDGIAIPLDGCIAVAVRPLNISILAEVAA